MGANVKGLRVRIRSVNSTLHLTKAMGLVASSKIRRAQVSMNASGEYRDVVSGMISQLTQSAECMSSPFMKTVDNPKRMMIVVAGDRGLAGGYNNNIFRLAAQYPDARVIGIGKRAADRYSDEEGYLSAEEFSLDDCIALARRLRQEFLDGKFQELDIVCTHYQNMLTQTAEIRQLLPLVRPEEDEETAGVGTLFEPDSLTVLNAAVEEYLSGMIYGCVRESYACEVASRRTAMDSASKNAQEMIDNLSLEYNRARQGAITQEITEIVAGANETDA